MRKLNNDEFEIKLIEKLGNEYSRVGNYTNTKTNIKIKHLVCNNTFESKPYNILQGYGCPYCNKKENKGQEGFTKIVFDLVGNEYTVLGDYKNYHSKILVKHNICNYEWEIRAGNFTSLGRRCPKCAGIIKKDVKYVQDCLDSIIPNEYTVLGDYKNNVTPILVKHNTCDNDFEASLKNIQKGKFSCPKCRMSSGELIVSKILDKLNIVYEYQYKDTNCKDKKILPFDFKFTINDNKYIIEYDGRQHFLPIFGCNDDERIKNLKLTQKHDVIKNNFCHDNNIHLLRVKYNLSINEIEDLINNFLK